MKQKEIVKTHFSQITQQINRFQELLNCQICYCKVTQPTMCPHCSKLYCEGCISKSLKLKPECPNCRKLIKGPLTNCSRFLNELAQIVSNLVEFGEQTQKCQQHNINLNYFCEDCNKSACCECKMFGEHQLHTFKPISLIYQEKYNKIRDLLTKFKANIIHKQQDILQIQNDLIAIKTSFEAQITQIDLFAEKYKDKMILEQSTEQNQVAQKLHKMIQQLDSLKEQIQTKIQQAKRVHCYKTDHQLKGKIQKILIKCKEMLSVNKNVSALQEVIPAYKKFTFMIHNYKSRKFDTQPLYSEPMEYEGSLWRLTVYLQGNLNNKNYISLFVQLVQNPDNINHYEYSIELVHPTESKKTIVKEHQTRFTIKQCWGYSKLINNQELENAHFVNEQSDCLEVCFGVRFCYYHDLYQRRNFLVQLVDKEMKEQDQEISRLQSMIQMGSNTSIKY